jgi:hypothetical protein
LNSVLCHFDHEHVLRGNSFLCAPTRLAIQTTIAVQNGASGIFLFLFLIAVEITVPSSPGATVIQGHILTGEVVALTSVADVVTTSLRQSAGAGREFGRNNSVGSNPVRQGVFAVLNNGLTSFITIVGLTGLAGSDRGVIDKLEEVLSIACNNGNLLTMLTESIELVGIGCLHLLSSDVGKLSLSNKRLGLRSNKFLFEDDNLGRVGLLVLELGDLISDLLLA